MERNATHREAKNYATRRSSNVKCSVKSRSQVAEIKKILKERFMEVLWRKIKEINFEVKKIVKSVFARLGNKISKVSLKI